MQKKKKGFTLVELLVVIAILAILAGVSVVGYLSFTNKAKESNDNSLVTQLNNVLLAEETVSGKPKTMSEALSVLENNGFVVEKLTPTSEKNEFVYDLKNNKFTIVKIDELLSSSLANYNSWIIVDNETKLNEVTKKYSVFLSDSYKDEDNSIVVNNGFDAGNYKLLTSVEYSNSIDTKDVVLKTNGGKLIVNGKYASDNTGDIVSHYGYSSVIEVNSVGMQSYHEFGTSSTINLKKGNLELESTSEVTDVIITTKNASEVKVKVKTSGNIPNIVLPAGSNSEAFNDVILSNDKVVEPIVNVEVSTFNDLISNLTKSSKYITLLNDISYPKNGVDLINIISSVTLNGNGYSIIGYGIRNGNSTSLAINNGGSKKIDVVIKNLTVNNVANNGRPIETRGNINSLTIDGCNLNASGIGNNQVITIGGNQKELANINILNTNISANNAGYCLISFNPINLNVFNSNLSGYGCLYLKGISGSEGSHGSKIYIEESNLDAPNVHSSEGSNDFGAIVLEDGEIDITLKNSSMNATATAGAKQYAVSLSSNIGNANSTTNVNVRILGSDTYINGELFKTEANWTNSSLLIEEGKFTVDPTAYITNNSTFTKEGLLFVVTK